MQKTSEPISAASVATDLYLDLLKRVLTRRVALERYRPLNWSLWRTADLTNVKWGPTKFVNKAMLAMLRPILAKNNMEVVRRYEANWDEREQGRDWPPEAETMVGLRRLDNVQACIENLVRDGVPGDLIEAGAWRGGCSIFMRAALSAFGDHSRKLWVADSFEGLPKPRADEYPSDNGDNLWQYKEYLGVSIDAVKENFKRYGLLDDRVMFLKGWFKDTLPSAPIHRLALIRLDGDMYESTIQALEALYPKLSPGGFLIIDDYALETCKSAVDDYRRAHGIREPIHQIDWSGIYWRRS